MDTIEELQERVTRLEGGDDGRPLTPEELANGRVKPRRRPPGLLAKLSPPELLAGPNCKLTGRPIPEEGRLAELPHQRAAREERDWIRFKAWANLDARAKTQLVADIRWGTEDAPAWLVQCVATGNGADPGQPAIILRAADQANARQNYLQLCGITSYGGCEIIASLWTPPEE
jgi:hypothetical protein